jgi:hypothetical protein
MYIIRPAYNEITRYRNIFSFRLILILVKYRCSTYCRLPTPYLLVFTVSTTSQKIMLQVYTTAVNYECILFSVFNSCPSFSFFNLLSFSLPEVHYIILIYFSQSQDNSSLSLPVMSYFLSVTFQKVYNGTRNKNLHIG